ncbi:MAG: 3'-5' exonuclease [Erysipelotrichaceae bacterium]|nr:3'-5' exonuclease [Erysipelotrichaceae bacterium]
MNDYLLNLNDRQLQAVTTKSQYVRVIAGAGSGKTRVLTTRILYLIDQWGIPSENILAITFTNKAAKEMKDRIEKMVDDNGNSSFISTIHSFCLYFLRREIKVLDYPSNFSVIDTDDQKLIIKEAIKQYDIENTKGEINNILNYISNNKAAGIDCLAALDMANNDKYTMYAKAYQYYMDRCKQQYYLDFDDLLLFTNRILKTKSQIKEKWQKKYQFILVDEFQDIDNVQYELISHLASATSYVYVVGDPDQTIYSWRGANINIILDFDKKFKNAETIILNQNYRSTQNILNGANSLISYNKNRVKKDLISQNSAGDKIIHFSAGSEESESMYIVDKINSFLAKGNNYQDIAILYRSNYLSRSIEKRLVDYHIPYIIYGGIRFYERKEIKDMLAYLKMLSIKDDISVKRTINIPKRGIGDKSIDALFDYARENNLSLYQAIDTYQGSGEKKMKAYKQLIDELTEQSNDKSLTDLFDMVFQQSGYREMLTNSKDPEDANRLENIKELMNDIEDFSKSNVDATLDDYLANVALYTDIQNSSDENVVRLMTVHAAKGLEFDIVFVCALSDGIFPSQRSIEESGNKGLEEERRLAYVAFTRARKVLILTDNRGFSYSEGASKRPSRFIEEIDSQYLKDYNKVVNDNYYNSSSSTVISHNKTVTSSKYKNGDKVYHDVFGEGIVLKSEGGNVQIAFSFPYGVKTIAASFPKLHKMKD